METLTGIVHRERTGTTGMGARSYAHQSTQSGTRLQIETNFDTTLRRGTCYGRSGAGHGGAISAAAELWPTGASASFMAGSYSCLRRASIGGDSVHQHGDRYAEAVLCFACEHHPTRFFLWAFNAPAQFRTILASQDGVSTNLLHVASGTPISLHVARKNQVLGAMRSLEGRLSSAQEQLDGSPGREFKIAKGQNLKLYPISGTGAAHVNPIYGGCLFGKDKNTGECRMHPFPKYTMDGNLNLPPPRGPPDANGFRALPPVKFPRALVSMEKETVRPLRLLFLLSQPTLLPPRCSSQLPPPFRSLNAALIRTRTLTSHLILLACLVSSRSGRTATLRSKRWWQTI
eukprot:3153605-Rhodomonas_salina.1